MYKKFILSVFSICLIILTFNNVNSQNIGDSDIEYVVRKSNLIVHGKVVDSFSYWNPDKSTILSDLEVEIYSFYKGKLSTSTVTIQLIGGTLDNISTFIAGGSNFEVGEEIFLFLKPPLKEVPTNLKHKYHLTSLISGKYSVRSNSNNEKLVFRNNSTVQLLQKQNRKDPSPATITSEGVPIEEFIKQINRVIKNKYERGS